MVAADQQGKVKAGPPSTAGVVWGSGLMMHSCPRPTTFLAGSCSSSLIVKGRQQPPCQKETDLLLLQCNDLGKGLGGWALGPYPPGELCAGAGLCFHGGGLLLALLLCGYTLSSVAIVKGCGG